MRKGNVSRKIFEGIATFLRMENVRRKESNNNKRSKSDVIPRNASILV